MAGATEPVLARFAGQIRTAAAQGTRLRIRGGGSKDFYGGPLEGEPLETRAYSGVTSYEPTELVVSARSGTPLAELEALLAGSRQMLAFEPPHFGPGATLGGCIAAGLAGPRRAANGTYYGAVRDFVLGCSLMDGRGEAMRFGGQVMKNVAGYDVSRLAVGSLGTLGLILEVSLKVLPLPVARGTLRFSLDEAGALDRLTGWAGQPLPVTASVWHAGELTLRLEGAQAAVAAARARLGGESIDAAQADPFWHAVREQTAPYFCASGPLWRVSVPPTARPLGLPGAQLIEWGGALRWWRTGADAAAVRAAAASVGGHATLFRGGERGAGVFTPLDPVLERLHRKLRAAFDPAGVFSHARLYSQC